MIFRDENGKETPKYQQHEFIKWTTTSHIAFSEFVP